MWISLFKKGFCETHLSFEMFILKTVIHSEVQTKILEQIYSILKLLDFFLLELHQQRVGTENILCIQ